MAEAALGSVRETLKEQGLPTGKISFVEARTAHEIAKAHLARPRLQEKKGALIDRARAMALVFRLARQERDAWITWPGPCDRWPEARWKDLETQVCPGAPSGGRP